jgi:hypothetical protein
LACVQDGLKSGAKDLTQSTKRVYLDLKGEPYVTCQKCNAHVPVDRSKVSRAAAAAPAEGQPAPAAAAAPGGVGVQEGVYSGEIVQCPSCKNPIG